MIELYDNHILPLTYSTRDSELGDYPLVHGSLQFRTFKVDGETIRRVVVVFTAFVREGKIPELMPFFAPILLEFSKSLKQVIYENAFSERGVYYSYMPGKPDSTIAFLRSPIVMRLQEDLLN